MLKGAALKHLTIAKTSFLSQPEARPDAALARLRVSLANAASAIELTDEFQMWADAAWQAAKIIADERGKGSPEEQLIARLSADFERFMDNCIKGLQNSPPSFLARTVGDANEQAG
ncbi:MAG TPA: hypothetical protein VMF90_11385 [Rhizobiaceae bacterium]|nr:hypothetical protein [Rhizobiaceae bacterium]